jgi:hypothetical protein
MILRSLGLLVEVQLQSLTYGMGLQLLLAQGTHFNG